MTFTSDLTEHQKTFVDAVGLHHARSTWGSGVLDLLASCNESHTKEGVEGEL